MIDMNSSDLSFIYSTLHFVCSEASRYHSTPMITFDQLLYWKALNIIQGESADSPIKNMILRLGGFHLQMSFLGSIGHIMHSSGLFEILETIYATNAVEHMLTGKALSRTVRGHMLVDSALNMMLTSHVFNISLPRTEQSNETETSNERQEEDHEELTVESEPNETQDTNAEAISVDETDGNGQMEITREQITQTDNQTNLETMSKLYDRLLENSILTCNANGPELERFKEMLMEEK